MTKETENIQGIQPFTACAAQDMGTTTCDDKRDGGLLDYCETTASDEQLDHQVLLESLENRFFFTDSKIATRSSRNTNIVTLIKSIFLTFKNVCCQSKTKSKLLKIRITLTLTTSSH